MNRYKARRLIATATLVAGASFAILPASGAEASFQGGTCPVNGWMCFWHNYPRTSDNGAYSSRDADMSGEHYPSSGDKVEDHNKDNANFMSVNVEIYKKKNYTGGVQLVLTPNTGQVVSSPDASSFRTLTNSCSG